jgi:hypothetical protein
MRKDAKLLKDNSIVPSLSKEKSSLSDVTTCSQSTVTVKGFPHNLPDELNLILSQNGNTYCVRNDSGNPYVLAVGSKQLNNVIRANAQQHNLNLRQADIRDINHSLQAYAESAGICREVWYRVAKVEGGIEIDIGDNRHSRVRITAGKMEIVKEGSTTLFFRTPLTMPMTMPREVSE